MVHVHCSLSPSLPVCMDRGNVSAFRQYEHHDPKPCFSLFFYALQQRSCPKYQSPVTEHQVPGHSGKDTGIFSHVPELHSPHMNPAKLTLFLALWFPVSAVLSMSLPWSPDWNSSDVLSLTLHLSQCLYLLTPHSYLLTPHSPSVSDDPLQLPLYWVSSMGLLVVSPSNKHDFLSSVFCHQGPASFSLVLQSHWQAFLELARSTLCQQLHLFSWESCCFLCLVVFLSMRGGSGFHLRKKWAPGQTECFWGKQRASVEVFLPFPLAVLAPNLMNFTH